MDAVVEQTLLIATGRLAGQMLAARRTQKHYERIAMLYRQKARIAHPALFVFRPANTS